MGFEWGFGADQVDGWAPEEPIKTVCGAAEGCRSVGGVVNLE